MNMYKIKQHLKNNTNITIHFIGIGGVGMCGIAEIMHNIGYKITGSDISSNYNIARLIKYGITVSIGHDIKHVENAQIVVISSAIDSNNCELIAAKEKNIPILSRAVMLSELMRFKYGIAIAGTHGKTTTTSLCAEVFSAAQLDPTFVIGGKLGISNSNSKLGLGDYLIAEADESDGSFLHLSPIIAVVTNIECDHMENYNHDEEILKNTFLQFLSKLPFYGHAIVCLDDANIADMLTQINQTVTCAVITYGFSKNCDIYTESFAVINGKLVFELNIFHQQKVQIEVNLFGRHNVLNAMATVAVGLVCGLSIEQILPGLQHFGGVARRCQYYGRLNNIDSLLNLCSKINALLEYDIQINHNYEILLFDDYGHHPTEIKTTIEGLQLAYSEHKIILIFQPHRFSRVRDLFTQFIDTLAKLNIFTLVLTEVYAAGEVSMEGYTGANLFDQINLYKNNNNHRNNTNYLFIPPISEIKNNLYTIIVDDIMLNKHTENKYLILTMGAGNITTIAQSIYNDW